MLCIFVDVNQNCIPLEQSSHNCGIICKIVVTQALAISTKKTHKKNGTKEKRLVDNWLIHFDNNNSIHNWII
jgi:hypothetical protein